MRIINFIWLRIWSMDKPDLQTKFRDVWWCPATVNQVIEMGKRSGRSLLIDELYNPHRHNVFLVTEEPYTDQKVCLRERSRRREEKHTHLMFKFKSSDPVSTTLTRYWAGLESERRWSPIAQWSPITTHQTVSTVRLMLTKTWAGLGSV